MYTQRKFVSIIGMISAVLFISSLLYNQFIPSVYLLCALVIGVTHIFIVIFNKLPKIIIIFVSFLFILTSIFLVYTQYSAQRILDYHDNEVSVVSFIVLKTSKIEKIEDANGKFFGKLSIMDKDLSDFLSAEVKTKFGFDLNILTFNEIEDAFKSLENGNIEVLLLDDSIWEYLRYENPEVFNHVKVIYTLSKEIIKDDITKMVEVDKESFIVLISGIDTFGSINRRSRSDVNMLLVVNPNTGKLLMVSLPRDLFVPLACKDNAFDKLTHSGIYGINCTVQTIERFFDIDVNYYVRLNFTSFINIVDAMDGVNIYNETDFVSRDGVTFKKGDIQLDGTLAHHYVRERKVFADGDEQRIKNQQKVLEALMKKMLTPGIFLKIESIISIVSRNIDSNISSKEVSALVKLQLSKGIDWQFSSAFITGTEDYRPTYSIGSLNLFVVIPDNDSKNSVKATINDLIDGE